MNARQWAMFLHFSLLAGLIIPILGLIVPIIIWQLKKTDLPEIDAHGKVVVNWSISAIIYWVITCGIIFEGFINIGVSLLFILIALLIFFSIIGGIKANNGELWKYPLSIQFLK